MSFRSRMLIPTIALLAAACSKDEPSPKPASAEPSASPAPSPASPASAKLSIEPSIGGKVFLVGEHQCELAVYADGRVEGLVFDASGNAVPPERVAEFSTALSAEADARPRVRLLWDAAAKRFRGQVEVQAALTTRPIDVTLQIDAGAQTGVLEGYALLPAPSIEAEGDATLKPPAASAKLGAKAKALADAKAHVPVIKAPNAAASLQAKAGTQLSVPKPKVVVAAKPSAATEKKKKTGVSVKAKASFGFGN